MEVADTTGGIVVDSIRGLREGRRPYASPRPPRGDQTPFTPEVPTFTSRTDNTGPSVGESIAANRPSQPVVQLVPGSTRHHSLGAVRCRARGTR